MIRLIQILSVFLLFTCRLALAEEPTIIFYNYNQLPFEHCEKVLKQAKLFNPDTKILFIDSLKAQSKKLNEIKKMGIGFVPSESIRHSSLHKKYKRLKNGKFFVKEENKKDPLSKWFVLYDYIAHVNLKNVFFVDMDNLLYVHLKQHFAVFENYYPHLAIPFENEEIASHSILYIHSAESLGKLNQYLIQEAQNFSKSSKIFGQFKKEFGNESVDLLPILPEDYTQENLLISFDGNKPKERKDFSKNFSIFNSLFDSCAIGEYLSGYNLEVGFQEIGHVNNRSILNPYHFRFEFSKDEKGRKVPYMIHKGQKIKINNLKIESLKIDPFLSI